MHPLIRNPIQSISKMVGEPLSPLVDRTRSTSRVFHAEF